MEQIVILQTNILSKQFHIIQDHHVLEDLMKWLKK